MYQLWPQLHLNNSRRLGDEAAQYEKGSQV